jgi:flavoprotein
MVQETVQRICEHCGTVYTACPGKAVVHCVQCFACKQYQPFSAMYGKSARHGYCCRACETRDHWSSRLTFDVVLNMPLALYCCM